MAKTEFIWDVVTDNVMMEKDGAGSTQAVYTQEPYQYGRLISQRRGNQTTYYHFDGNGNTRALTDAGENVTDTYTYTAFGDEVATTGTTKNRYRFGGQYGYQYNEPTQDYYVRERVYEPTRGRWTSKDPLRFIDGANMYLFVDNRPTAFFDPSGAATTVSTTVACPSCDAACTKLKCYWDNAIADMKAHVRISFLKEIRDDKGKGVTTTKCRVDRGFSGIGAAKGKPQLVLILTFADGTTTGNFGKRYSELRSKHGATFHGNLVTPRPGVRPYIQISKEHKGRKLASVEFQERLQLDCTCGGAEQQVFWCFNLKWSKGATSGWEKVVPRGTDCHKIMPKEKEDRKPVPAPRPWANH